LRFEVQAGAEMAARLTAAAYDRISPLKLMT
jgi:hypothetical protein